MADSKQTSVIELEQVQESYLFPCSVVQRTCWYLERMYPGTASNNIAVRFMLHGNLDISLLEQSFREQIQRHEVLRTRFVAEDGEPKQLVESSAPFSLPVVSLLDLPEEDRKTRAEVLASEEARIGFDIEKGPLFRCKLIEMGSTEFMLLLTMHHIISDGWSIGIVTNEIGEIYEALVERRTPSLAPLAIQYGDYATWQQNWIADGELEQRLAELKQKFDGFTPLDIPTDFERPSNPTARGEIRSILLPRSLTDSLKQFSDQHGCTLFVTMFSALLFLLEIESKQSDLAIRTQTSGRGEVELESLIGWFVNSIVLRIDASGDPKFEELVETARQTVLDAFDYQHIPFERVMEVVRPKQNSLKQPPFQVNFIFQRDFVRPWLRGGIQMTPIPSKSTGTFVDLNIFLVERDDGWRASVDVNTDVFDPKTGDFLLNSYKQILETVAKNSASRASEINLPARPLLPKVSPETSPIASFDHHVPARNEQEKTIIEIWQRVLNVDGIGAYSNFFDLGGHSLNAVKMLAELKARFGRDIQLAALFVDPTPAAMAQVISGERVYADERGLIYVQPQGTRPPFFMIGGDHWFRPLANRLGVDQPLLGITLQRYESRSEPTSFLEIGRDLAKVIVEVNPSGPYILGGWCVDGTIAYEVAQQLRAMNRAVSCVILLDAVNPTYRRLYRSRVRAVGRAVRRTVDLVREAGHLDSRGARAHLWDGFRDIGCRVGRALVPSSTVAEQNPEILQNDPDRQEFRKLLYIAEEEYTPAPTPIPLMLLRSSIEAYRDPDLGWRDVAQTSLETVEVQGDHIGMFREPHVASLASVLSEYLSKHAPSNCRPDKR